MKKYGKLSAKFVVTNPWEVLFVDLIGPYTLKARAECRLTFMCVTMIDPASSWFKTVELPVSKHCLLDISTCTKGCKGTIVY
jgi:hypothetical protein